MRNLERAGVPRSVAMKLVGHKTESVHRWHAIVSEHPIAPGALIEPRTNGAVARMQSGIPRSHLPDSAPLHPGYPPHDRFVHEQSELSEGVVKLAALQQANQGTPRTIVPLEKKLAKF
ncbi:MAG: hypothetical protein HY268_25005 [Deltaproteobacteria bacterium]|nr:hypothetical protein [Deltaproteobacteria bacterium]